MSMEITRIFRDPLPADMGKVKAQKSGIEPQAVQQTSTKSHSHQNIADLVGELQTVTQILNRRLKFTINRQLDQVVVKVIDTSTDKVIKELPPEEVQQMHVRIREAIGLLIDETI